MASKRPIQWVKGDFDIPKALELADKFFEISAAGLAETHSRSKGEGSQTTPRPIPRAPIFASPERLRNLPNSDASSSTSATCRALAIELCFKSIIRAVEGKVPRTHDLLNLWDAIRPQWQSAIRRAYEKQSATRRLKAMVTLRWTSDTESGPDRELAVRCGGDLDRILEQSRHDFENWRYAHELEATGGFAAYCYNHDALGLLFEVVRRLLTRSVDWQGVTVLLDPDDSGLFDQS